MSITWNYNSIMPFESPGIKKNASTKDTESG